MNESFATHEVFNQSPPLADFNRYATDAALREAVDRCGSADSHDWLHARGAELGSADMLALADDANRFPPHLQRFDAQGRPLDCVEFHPAYHQLMTYLKRHGVAAGPWALPGRGAHVRRAALFYLYAQVEDGTLCPNTMTYASVPALRRDAALAAEWLPRICAPDYDARFLPARLKRGVTLGMGMTEKQGGSDVRANTSCAEAAGGRAFRITGHKWFFSAPMCDAFLVLAQAPGGLSCFLLPRFAPDGAVNAIRIQRLKDKLGDRSNASSEVEFNAAYAELVGEEGRGVATILEMGTYCRLDCALGSAGLIRGAVTHALHHAHHRKAFGRHLVAQPLMANVLADLSLESEAATALAMRVASAFDTDNPDDDPPERRMFRRLLTPVAKYWICKRGPMVAAEAMEVLGGNGYVEDGPLARVYRQMPLNSIWEGSGNLMALDVLRALAREPACAAALDAELALAQGGNVHLDAYVNALRTDVRAAATGESDARSLTQRIALAVQGALLVRFAPAFVADSFCASRLASGGFAGGAFGALPNGVDHAAIIARAWPA